MFEGGGRGRPTCATYSKFLEDFSWYHIVATLSSGDYLNMERVLGENVGDCMSYLQYLSAKNDAEEAQIEYENKMNKSRRK